MVCYVVFILNCFICSVSAVHDFVVSVKGVSFFGPKSEYIVSGSDCGNIYFWDKGTESIVQWMLGDENGVVRTKGSTFGH
jgi:hypothetical protein